MSSDCSFYEHIDLKIKQCRQLTGWILRTFKARDKSTMLTLFKSLVLPRLEYGCQLWCPATVNQIRAMESIQRKFTKHIDGLYSLSYWFAYVLITTTKREICSHLCVENTGRYGSQLIATHSREPLGKKRPHVCAECG